MTENEAIKQLKDILGECTESEEAVCYITDVDAPALEMAIKALEKQEKIKEAFEMWKAETGGYYGADDETTSLIGTLKKILRI